MWADQVDTQSNTTGSDGAETSEEETVNTHHFRGRTIQLQRGWGGFLGEKGPQRGKLKV